MSSPDQKPLVVAVDMGYGHMRAAAPLADALGAEVLQVDRAPLVASGEERLWGRVRRTYEGVSRLSQVPWVGAPLRRVLEAVTDIPGLYPYRDLSAPTRGVHTLDRLVRRRGLGRGLVAELRRTGAPLLTTFYSPAIVADAAGLERIYCVATDSDLNRIWAPAEPRRTRIHYLVPTRRAARRLRSYGVPEDRITFTGFPLPDALVGGPSLATLEANLAARVVRLDPAGEFRRSVPEELAHFLGALPSEEEGRPPLLTFAVGGAGAQAGMAAELLPGFRRALEEGALRICLVAGVRADVEARFREIVRRAGMESLLGGALEILLAPTFREYYDRFNALLARTDVLWTKPSELTFYGALGIPLVLAPPVGVHERYNRRWARESGAGLKQRDARFASEWLADWLADGVLAAAAWAGYMRLPKFGLYRILEAVGAAPPTS
jgi:UDP-N-acetylglucosamine:LPS N-acetylglucosamine transferase